MLGHRGSGHCRPLLHSSDYFALRPTGHRAPPPTSFQGTLRLPPLPVALLGLMLLGYSALFGYLAVQEHDTFSTNAFDLGNMDQAIWNTLQGRFFQFTNYEGVDTRLAVHVEPILIPISLLYVVYSSPKTLLMLQTLVVALGALPIYSLARSQLRSPWLALIFPLAYLLFPALEAANMFDFHPVTLSASFLSYAFWAMHRHRYGWFMAFSVLAMSTKEEIPLVIAMLGTYLALVHRSWRWGTMATVTAAAWFYVAVYMVLPYFNPEGSSPYLGYYAYLGGTPQEMAHRLLTQPELLLERMEFGLLSRYLASLLAPVAFLSLLSPHLFLLSITSLAINVLSENPLMRLPNTFHYAAPIVPFAVISSIFGVRRLAAAAGRGSAKRGQVVAAALCCLILLSSLTYHRFYGFSPLSENFVWKGVTDHQRIGGELAAMIPREAAVSTSSALNPHVSQREQLYVFPRLENADYVFLDVTGPSIPLTAKEVRDTVLGLLERGEFGVLVAEDGFILLKRGLPGAKDIPDSFYSFARTEDIPSTARLFTGWEGQPESLAFDYRFSKYPFERYRMPVIILYWLLPPNREMGYSLRLLAREPSGQVLWEGLDTAPAAVWYPPDRWRAGEVVKVETMPLSLGSPWSEIPGDPAILQLEVASSEDPSWGQPLLELELQLGALSVRQVNGGGIPVP